MPSYNRIILIGRLTRDPELRYTSSGLAVTTFSIAVDRFQKNEQGERQTDFFRCKAWRQKAEFVQQYIQKGRLVAIDGRIELNEYTAQDGTRRTGVDVVCDTVETLDSQRDGGGGDGGAMPARPQGGARGAGGGEYFDDEVAAAPARSQGAPQGGPGGDEAPRPQAAAPAARPQAARPQGDAPQGARPQGGQGAPQGAPARGAQAQPAYPQNDYDFDDSDPFADE